MTHYPQVILFGSIAGDWREKAIIPVLEELGAQVRGQTFILQIDHDLTYGLPESLQDHPDAKEVDAGLKHWIKSSRYLVDKHARAFNIPTMHVADTLDDIVTVLRQKYG